MTLFKIFSVFAVTSVYFGFFCNSDKNPSVQKGEVLCVVKDDEPVVVGDITAVEVVHEVDRDKGQIRYEYNSEKTTKCKMNISIYQGRIERLQDMSVFNQLASGVTVYSVMTGKTKVEANEPTRITCEGKTTIKDTRSGKLVLVEESSFSSSTNGCDWSISLDPYKPADLAALIRGYCLKSAMVGNIRSFTNKNKYFATGEIKGVRLSVGKDKLESFSEKAGVTGIPNFGYNQSEKTPEKTIIPMVITEAAALEKYLLNPQGGYQITVHGEKRTNLGGKVSEYSVDITLDMYALATLAPLTKGN
jgi:hypothetical protein